ncbi:MAG: Protein component of the small (40S) ribosomal subunit [Marteilia pararefringens]
MVDYVKLFPTELAKFGLPSQENRTGCSYADVPNQKLLETVKKVLCDQKNFPSLPKGKFDFSKLSCANELPPADIQDAYRTRCASILIHLANGKIYGVKQMAHKFKRVQNRGVRTNVVKDANRGLIRFIFQSLENMKLIEKVDGSNDRRSGRKISKKGTSLVYSTAHSMNFPKSN